jgi:tRNA(Ile)-lysidine synthase
MKKDVQTLIREHALIAQGDHVLVAVSGGADSMALLQVLCDLRADLDLTLTVVHLDHGTRKGDSAADAAFVEALAADLDCGFTGERVDVPACARRRGVSFEMAARDERYAFFARAATACKAGVVAIAHTADDQAETVLLRLVRGAGVTGLGAMAPRTTRDGVTVVRPLLNVTRRAVEAFLRSRQVSWREDVTNRDRAFLRNRVRHELVPLLQARFNPGIAATLHRTAEVLRDEDAWLDELTRALLVSCREDDDLAVDRLRAVPLAARRRILRRWLMEAGVPVEGVGFDTAERLERLVSAVRGTGRVPVPGAWTVQREYDRLRVVKGAEPPAGAEFRAALAVPGETLVPEADLWVRCVVEPGLVKDRPGRPGRLPARASLSAAAVGRKRLVIRSRQPGDRMRPLGLRGSKKLQDILVDAKVPSSRRDRVPVVACGGEIVWIPGYRVARGWEVTDPTTPALQLTVSHL